MHIAENNSFIEVNFSLTFADINECLDRNGGCSQKCLNFDGGYRCSCKAGYVLGHDRKTCSGIDIKMFLDDVHASKTNRKFILLI